LENLQEINKFLDIYDHPKLNQEAVNHLSRSIISNKIKAEIEFPKKKKNSEPERFTDEFHQTFKEEPIPTLLKLFYEIEREGTLSKLF
jgi:hypothetical protein